MALSFDQIRERLAARFGDAVGPTVAAKDPFVVVQGARLLEVSRFLHDDPELALDYLVDATGVDYPKENLVRLVYHLGSMSLKHGFKFKVELDRAAPKVASVESVWRGANWLEREVYDLLGVSFEGHPDLRRLMLPDDWQGHPLRKDYEMPSGYHGIGHGRVSTLETNLERDKALRAEAAKNAPPAPTPAPAAAPAQAAPAPAAAPAAAEPAKTETPKA